MFKISDALFCFFSALRFQQGQCFSLTSLSKIIFFQKYLKGKRTCSGQQINFQLPINLTDVFFQYILTSKRRWERCRKNGLGETRKRCKRDLCQAYAEPSMCQLAQNNTTLFCIASFIQSVSQNHFTGVKQYSYRDK